MGGQTFSTSQFVDATPDVAFDCATAAVTRMSGFKVRANQPHWRRLQVRRGHGLTNSPLTLTISVRPEGDGALIVIEGVSSDTRMMANGAREVQREAARFLAYLSIPRRSPAATSEPGSPALNSPEGDSLVARMATLKQLFDQELISDGEYAAKRAEILDSI